MIRYAVDFEIAERIVQLLHVDQLACGIHVGRASVSHDVPFKGCRTRGILRLVNRVQVLPGLFCVRCILG